MRNQVQIANWLLTRRCNLRCDYCALVKDYSGKPQGYPDMKYYKDQEMSTEFVLSALKRLHAHNPDMFHIFYGGEPTLRADLPDIVSFCNANSIYYTIITNNTPEIQPFLKKLFENVSHVAGLTSSVDPLIFAEDSGDDSDRIKKSIEGLKRLKQYGDIVDDVVAEITIDNENYKYIYELVKELSDNDISSSITFIDVAKTPYYDFSNVNDDSLLVNYSLELQGQFDKILADDSLNIHMKDVILPRALETLPANLDCKIEDNLHNITIEADGSLRLCLRIRGIDTPKLSLFDYFSEDGTIDDVLYRNIRKDKDSYCKLCNWTCMIMSEHVSLNESVDDLVHADRRG